MTQPSRSSLFSRLLVARGLSNDEMKEFLNPKYENCHDPFLLPDMQLATDRIAEALQKQEHITIYGDYDVDGIAATAILHDALKSFGFKYVNYLLPERLVDGYGISMSSVKKIKSQKPSLVITVDCGSSSTEEITALQNSKIDVIVTDHHELGANFPPAVAVINQKRSDSKYPFAKLSGAGIAFKLVQALQTKLPNLPVGQEKWFLDLVALGTVCDCMELTGENRILVHYGLKVLAKTRRLGLRALVEVAKVDPNNISARTLGFQLGPRLNAAGRVDSALAALELLLCDTKSDAFASATTLNQLNLERRRMQNAALSTITDTDLSGPVLFVRGDEWHEGIIGIIAGRLVDTHHKPAFVFTKSGDFLKGSARSFGNLSLSEAIHSCPDGLVIKGGGHSEAAGVTVDPDNYNDFKQHITSYFTKHHSSDSEKFFVIKEDIIADSISELTVDFYNELQQLAPFGQGNPEPIFKLQNVHVRYVDRIGSQHQHLKITAGDPSGSMMKLLAFNSPESWVVSSESYVDLWFNLELNDWNGTSSVEGRILRIECCG